MIFSRLWYLPDKNCANNLNKIVTYAEGREFIFFLHKVSFYLVEMYLANISGIYYFGFFSHILEVYLAHIYVRNLSGKRTGKTDNSGHFDQNWKNLSSMVQGQTCHKLTDICPKTRNSGRNSKYPEIWRPTNWFLLFSEGTTG